MKLFVGPRWSGKTHALQSLVPSTGQFFRVRKVDGSCDLLSQCGSLAPSVTCFKRELSVLTTIRHQVPIFIDDADHLFRSQQCSVFLQQLRAMAPSSHFSLFLAGRFLPSLLSGIVCHHKDYQSYFAKVFPGIEHCPQFEPLWEEVNPWASKPLDQLAALQQRHLPGGGILAQNALFSLTGSNEWRGKSLRKLNVEALVDVHNEDYLWPFRQFIRKLHGEMRVQNPDLGKLFPVRLSWLPTESWMHRFRPLEMITLSLSDRLIIQYLLSEGIFLGSASHLYPGRLLDLWVDNTMPPDASWTNIAARQREIIQVFATEWQTLF